MHAFQKIEHLLGLKTQFGHFFEAHQDILVIVQFSLINDDGETSHFHENGIFQRVNACLYIHVYIYIFFNVQTGKTTVIRRTAIRETGVSSAVVGA